MTPNPHPYSTYKPTGVPWFGDMPADWDVRRIKTLFRESEDRRGQRPMELLSLTRTKGLIPQSENSNSTLLAEDLSQYKVCRPTDIVMNRMQAWSGMFAVPPREGIVSPDYSVFKPTKICEIKFFEHLFKTPILVEQFAKESKGIGTGFNRLYSDNFGNIAIALPPLGEQAAIVRYLDHADRRIRRYVAAKRKLIALLEKENQAIINQAITRGLDPNLPLKPSGVEWLGDVPEHWEVARLKGHVANVVELTREPSRDDIYLALEHVESWTGRFAAAGDDIGFDSQVKRFRAGDVLFGKLRPYLAKVVCPDRSGVCAGEFLVLRPNITYLSPKYLEQLLRSRSVIDAIDASTFGAKMPRADWHFIGDMQVPLPPLPEQRAVVEYLDKATGDIGTAIERTRRQIELVQEYRTRLIADVVTGKLDVREAAAQLLDEAADRDPIEESGPLADGTDEDLYDAEDSVDELAIEREVTV